MRTAAIIVATLLAIVATSFIGADGPGPVSFVGCEVMIDSGQHPLGAYQIEIKADRPGAKVVGVEGGSHPEFKGEPYYDPAALQGGRVIIGAFSLAEAEMLPKGKNRVAWVSFMVEDSATTFTALVQTAGDDQGHRIDVDVSTAIHAVK